MWSSESVDGLLGPRVGARNKNMGRSEHNTTTLWVRKRRTRHVKNRPDQTRTGQDQCGSPEGGKSGDRKTLGVCSKVLESASCRRLFGPKFFGHHFGHHSSSVAPITPQGPPTSTHWLRTGPIFSTQRTGQDETLRHKTRCLRTCAELQGTNSSCFLLSAVCL